MTREQTIEHNWPSPNWTIAPGASPGRDCCGTEDVDNDDHEALAPYNEGKLVRGRLSPCESCGSTSDGDRFPAHATYRKIGNWADTFTTNTKPSYEIRHIEICYDCLTFIKLRLEHAQLSTLFTLR